MKDTVTCTALIIFCALAGCREAVPPAPATQATRVETFTVAPSDGRGEVSVTGIVKAHLESDLAAQIVAPVASITKREGDHFRKGEVLIRLHAPALSSGVAQAKAAVGSAEKQAQASTAQATLAAATLARYGQLRERHSVTPYELDQVKAQSATAEAQQQSAAAQVAAAQSALAMQQANAADAHLYASFDGVVTRRLVDPGAMAAPGVPLLHLQSSGPQEVEFPVPESLLSLLHAGTKVAISSGDEPSLTARIATIAPSGDAGSHSFLVKATLPPASPWHSGALVQVAIPAQAAVPQMLIPSGCVVQQGGLDAVLAVDPDGRASVRYVTLGKKNGERMEVLTGVRPGDRLIRDASLGLAGKRVVVRP